jgi:chromosome segregation ATPase
MKPADRANVFSICDELNEQGIKPTLARVREGLGGGSFTTIQPLLKEWKDKRSEPAAETTGQLPDEVREVVAAAAAQIWTKAQAKAGEEYQALRESMENQLSESEAEKNEALSEVRRLEAETGSQADVIQKMESELTGYKEALQEAKSELKAKVEKLAEYEGLMKRHEELLLEVGELRGRIAELEKGSANRK